MIWYLLEQTGYWGIPLGALLLWSTVLVLHRLLVRRDLAIERKQRSRQLALLLQQWRQTGSQLAPGKDERLAAMRLATTDTWPDLADAAALPPEAFAAELLPRLAPAHRAAHANGLQLETCAALSPIIGLAGTIAGYYLTLQEIASADLSDGLAALAGPGSLAMTTSLLGIIPCVISMLGLGLIHLDADRTELAEELTRWHGRAHRAHQALSATVDEPERLQPMASETALLMLPGPWYGHWPCHGVS